MSEIMGNIYGSQCGLLGSSHGVLTRTLVIAMARKSQWPNLTVVVLWYCKNMTIYFAEDAGVAPWRRNRRMLTLVSFGVSHIDEAIYNLTHLLNLWDHTVAASLLAAFTLQAEHLVHGARVLLPGSVSLLPARRKYPRI